MIVEFDEIIGKTPSVGKLVEAVEDPDDPSEGLGVTLLEIPIPEPLSILVIHSEGRASELNTSSSVPRSRPPRKRTRALRDSFRVRVVKTPSVGMYRSDNLLGYLNQRFVLDSVWKIFENEVPFPVVREVFGESSRGMRRTNQSASLIFASSRYARSAAGSLADSDLGEMPLDEV
ncbi:hypothetical protein L1987_58092 [Smallanthus sonchifolius]|uniref:Uncharacterized protein n=1 Tax=Smallanthus sonchifolius TaxID=185202 RepID=A0ACB9DF50_9ASTR|nr:hypothetical protein L1987_58092 [Smallanthus sonchifolius]